ncbi:hypothetical protein ACPV5V_25095, partial [Vibrio campbellii]
MFEPYFLVRFTQFFNSIIQNMQLTIPEIENHLDSLAWGASDEEKGEVFTNPDIVNFMLKTSGISNAINAKSIR